MTSKRTRAARARAWDVVDEARARSRTLGARVVSVTLPLADLAALVEELDRADHRLDRRLARLEREVDELASRTP